MAEVIKEWDAFEIVAPPLGQALPVRGLKKGRPVSAGQLLAKQPAGPYDYGPLGIALCVPLYGDIHAPCSGIITEINEFEIIIQRDDQALGEPPLPRELHSLSPEDLATAVQELGFDVPQLHADDPIIINTFNPQPGHAYSAALFSEHRETMLAGVTAASRLWPEHRVIWAVADKSAAPDGAEFFVTHEKFPSAYPSRLKHDVALRFAIPMVTDRFGNGVFGGRELYFLGRLWRTGLPVTRMVITLGASSYFVPVGSRALDLLRFANLYPQGNDVILKGGLVYDYGHSLARLERGLGKDDAALVRVRRLRLPKPARPFPKNSQARPLHLYDGPYITMTRTTGERLLYSCLAALKLLNPARLASAFWPRLFSRVFFPQTAARLSSSAPSPESGQPGFTARLKCGHQGQAPSLAEYHGTPPTCLGASLSDQGPLVCPYGCLGYGDCATKCPHGAITLRKGFPQIDETRCTACGKCLNACHKNLLEIVPQSARAFIPCAAKSPLKKNAEYCPNACLGCGKCRKACTANAISRPTPFGAMQVNQTICQAHNETCGKPCQAPCPRKIL